jgi:hypothetical protein
VCHLYFPDEIKASDYFGISFAYLSW